MFRLSLWILGLDLPFVTSSCIENRMWYEVQQTFCCNFLQVPYTANWRVIEIANRPVGEFL